MSDDMLMHFSSNSSNQSDQSLPTKIAKLEARMVGKPPAAQQQQHQHQHQQHATWAALSSTARSVAAAEDLAQESSSSDSDDDVSLNYKFFSLFINVACILLNVTGKTFRGWYKRSGVPTLLSRSCTWEGRELACHQAIKKGKKIECIVQLLKFILYLMLFRYWLELKIG